MNKTTYYYKRKGLAYAFFRRLFKNNKNMVPLIEGSKVLTGAFYEYFRSLGEAECEAELVVQYGVFADYFKRKFDLSDPKTFTDKIQWLKLHGDIDRLTGLADKVTVREWVKERIGEEHLIPVVGGPWDNTKDIKPDMLPERFVLKGNQGSGMNFVVKDKRIDAAVALKLAGSWINTLYGWKGVERQYFGISPLIYAEKYMEDDSGGLVDYKVHCFQGKPRFMQVIGNRDLQLHTAYQKNYDFEWKDCGWVFEDYPAYDHPLPKPGCLDEIYEVAKKLSEDFQYVRVDLYVVDNKVYFGEMTFTPADGRYPYKGTWTRELDLSLGEDMGELPKRF